MRVWAWKEWHPEEAGPTELGILWRYLASSVAGSLQYKIHGYLSPLAATTCTGLMGGGVETEALLSFSLVHCFLACLFIEDRGNEVYLL